MNRDLLKRLARLEAGNRPALPPAITVAEVDETPEAAEARWRAAHPQEPIRRPVLVVFTGVPRGPEGIR